MIDFRYHLASLMAVFLALAIGMLIGNSFVGLASVEGQNRALKQLQKDVSAVRQQAVLSQQENAALRGQLNDRDRAIHAIAPQTVKGLLANRRIALIQIGRPRRAETATELASVLTAAGARVTSTTTLLRDWLPEDPPARSTLLRLLQMPPGEDAGARATRKLGVAITSGAWNGALHQIAALTPGVTLDGDYTVPVGTAVLIDYAEDPDGAAVQSEASAENQLAGVLRARGIRLVAAEPESAPASTVSFFTNRGVATVDNIDTAVGQIACAMAIVAGTGSYGTKPTADRLLPELPAATAPVRVAG